MRCIYGKDRGVKTREVRGMCQEGVLWLLPLQCGRAFATGKKGRVAARYSSCIAGAWLRPTL